MEVTVHQQIYYSNKERVPIKDVAESLLALESIIRQSPDILEEMLPGTRIEAVEVFIEELKSDSILEHLAIKFFFSDQQAFDEFKSNTLNAKERGMDIIKNKTLLSAIIVAMVFDGVIYYLGKDTSSKPDQKTIIEANNNTIIQIGANLVELQAEDFKAIIEGAISNKEKLAKDAASFVKPAKLDPAANITFNENNDLQISSESIRAMPSNLKELEEEEFIQDFTNINLEIRALDLDSSKRGWAVIIPALHQKRISLKLDPTVSPEDLLDKRNITADVTVIFRHDKEFNKIPRTVILRQLTGESANMINEHNP